MVRLIGCAIRQYTHCRESRPTARTWPCGPGCGLTALPRPPRHYRTLGRAAGASHTCVQDLTARRSGQGDRRSLDAWCIVGRWPPTTRPCTRARV